VISIYNAERFTKALLLSGFGLGITEIAISAC
jgi:hypothetical protein